MSEKDINKEAYEQAEKELLEGRVEKVKGYILDTLKKIESKKEEKQQIDEELRVLKLDLEDLRKGNFDKIEERQDKSKVARKVSVRLVPYTGCQSSVNLADWSTFTSGTYNTGTRVYYF